MRRRVAGVWLGAVLSATALAAQGGIDRSALAQLLQLEGKLVHVSYTPGTLDRAVRVQRRFEALAADLASWTKTKNRTRLLLHVFSREDWERAGLGLPYGFPARMPMTSVAVCAHGDAGTVELWRGHLGGPLPALDPRPMHGTPEEAASVVVVDLLAQVEAARALLARAGLLGAETWITELVAHAVVGESRARREPDVAEVAGTVAARLIAARAGEPGLPLAAYRQGLSIGDWLWFQARFHQGAAELLAASDGAGRKLVKLARKSPGPLDAAALLRRFPEVAAWRERSFAAE